MKTQPTKSQLFRRHTLSLAIATQLLGAATVYAGPTGGQITGGDGSIDQAGRNTTITQRTDRLAIDWETFNVARNESVRFNQPNQNSVALNRILDNNGSQILGRIDANGRVILMNPNGVFFGRNASINVGSLVATGLMIDTNDFMNGDLLLQAVDGSEGTVINRGTIRAATGGNVALIGKEVENSGFITAQLGHVALASGEQAVVTFDDQGLLGVSIDQATLDREVGVFNRGTVQAHGGKIVLAGSVTKDLFSRAVNSGDMGGNVQAVVHEDGSFTLGGGVDTVNNGSLDVGNAFGDAGEVTLVGNNVIHRGSILANGAPNSQAGDIHLQANEDVRITVNGAVSARASGESSGSITVVADNFIAQEYTQLRTTGDLNIRTYDLAQLAHTEAYNLNIRTIGEVEQTRPVLVSNNLHLDLAADAAVYLTHAENDFHSVSAEADYVSFANIIDRNDILLGDLRLNDSTLRVSARGDGARISQTDSSQIRLGDAALYLTADNIDLGENGSATTAHQSLLSLRFTESVNTRGSLSAPGTYNFSSFTAVGDMLPNRVSVNSQKAFDLDIQLVDFEGININTLNATNATLRTLDNITQTGPIYLDGDLMLSLTAGGDVKLDHAENDFNRVHMNLGYSTRVDLHGANDLLLGNLTIGDSSVNLTAQGTISQLANSKIQLHDTWLNLTANRVVLGGTPSSSTWVSSNSALFLHFAEHLATNQSISTPESAMFGWFSAEGSNGSNRLSATSEGEAFDLNITMDDWESIDIARLTADNATIRTPGQVSQSNAINLSTNLHLDLAVEADVNLTHSGNTIPQLTMETQYVSNVDLAGNHAIALGNMDLNDSNVRITVLGEGGTLSQVEGSAITMGDTALRLTADNILLGDNGSSTTAYGFNLLELNFAREVNTNGSVVSPGPDSFNWFTARSRGIEIQSEVAFDMHILNEGDTGIQVNHLNATDASFTTAQDIQQTGPLALDGTLHLTLAPGTLVDLTHPDNQIARFTGQTSYGSEAEIVAQNSIALSDMYISDGTIKITALGLDSSINQDADSLIRLSGNLMLTADHITLGENNSSTTANYGYLELNFIQSVDTNNSISAPKDSFNWFVAQSNNYPNVFKAESDHAFDLAVEIGEWEGIEIARLNAANASMSVFESITQTGPITLSDTLHLSLTAGGTVNLQNPLNDFNILEMNLGYTTGVRIADANDLTLGNSVIEDSIVYLTALGSGATISQGENTRVSGSESILTLTADRIDLGADGSSDISLYNIGILEMEFSQLLRLTGGITLGGHHSGFTVNGSEPGAELAVGENAYFDFRNSDFYDRSITLTGGEHFLSLDADLPVPVFWGGGNNVIHVNNPGIEYDLPDFDPENDTLVVLNP